MQLFFGYVVVSVGIRRDRLRDDEEKGERGVPVGFGPHYGETIVLPGKRRCTSVKKPAGSGR